MVVDIEEKSKADRHETCPICVDGRRGRRGVSEGEQQDAGPADDQAEQRHRGKHTDTCFARWSRPQPNDRDEGDHGGDGPGDLSTFLPARSLSDEP